MELCKKCKTIKDSKVNCLQSHIVPNSKLFIVGQCPGGQEEEKGEPFVGQSGMILMEVLKDCGVERKDVSIGNVVRCRPAKLNSTGYRSDRDPTKTEIKNCLPYLYEDIKKIKPQVILTVGTIAFNTLTHLGGIMNWRGKRLFLGEFNCILIPTIHPASILHKVGGLSGLTEDSYYLNLMLHDVRVAVEESKKNYHKIKTDYVIYNGDDNGESAKLFEQLVNDIWEKKYYAFDIETTGFEYSKDEILGISLSCKVGEGLYIPWRYIKENVQYVLSNVFTNEELIGCAHNGKFDIKFLNFNGFKVKNFKFDTMLAHHLLNENITHSLKDCAWEISDCGGYEDILVKFLPTKKSTYKEIPEEILGGYAGVDVDLTIRLYLKLKEKLKEEGLDQLFVHVMRTQKTVMNVELWGIKPNKEYLEQLHIDFSKKIVELEVEINSVVGKKINLNSTKQLQEVLFVQLKLPIQRKTEKGNASTDADTLEALARMHPLPAKIVERRKYVHWRKVFIEGIQKAIKEDNRVHSSFLIHGTKTGRLSCIEPNLQNIPRDKIMRNIFVADKGYKLINADYAQAELRILAHYCRDEKMLEAFETGVDIHSVVAKQLFNLPGAVEEVKKKFPNERFIAKCINFGIIFGMGAQGLMDEINKEAKTKVTLTECRQFIYQFFDNFKRINEYFDELIEFAKQNGYIVNLFGRRRRLPNILNNDSEKEQSYAVRELKNFPVQSGSADCLYIVMNRIFGYIEKNKLQSKIITTVHDSILFEVPDRELEEMKRVIVREMERSIPGLTVQMKVDLKIQDKWE